MIVRTWKPDICDCKFQISKDFGLENVINKCKMHDTLEDGACFTAVIQRDKDINLIPKLTNETDEEHQNRRWVLKEKALKSTKA